MLGIPSSWNGCRLCPESLGVMGIAPWLYMGFIRALYIRVVGLHIMMAFYGLYKDIAYQGWYTLNPKPLTAVYVGLSQVSSWCSGAFSGSYKPLIGGSSLEGCRFSDRSGF